MAEEEGALAATIREKTRRRGRQIRQKELARMVDEFYAPDAHFLPPNQPAIIGLDAIRDYWVRRPDEGLIELELESKVIDGSGDLAYEIGSFTSILRPRHGSLLQDHGKYVTVYRARPDDSYRAVADIFNSDKKD